MSVADVIVMVSADSLSPVSHLLNIINENIVNMEPTMVVCQGGPQTQCM